MSKGSEMVIDSVRWLIPQTRCGAPAGHPDRGFNSTESLVRGHDDPGESEPRAREVRQRSRPDPLPGAGPGPDLPRHTFLVVVFSHPPPGSAAVSGGTTSRLCQVITRVQLTQIGRRAGQKATLDDVRTTSSTAGLRSVSTGMPVGDATETCRVPLVTHRRPSRPIAAGREARSRGGAVATRCRRARAHRC